MGKWGTDNQICVKITIRKGCNDWEVIYYRNKLPMWIIKQWRWYFEYLAALVKINNPRKKVELIICVQTLKQGQEYIEEKRPVTADVFVFAPTAKNIDFTIAVSPNTVAVRSAVLSEMEAFFTRDAEPGGTVYLSRVSEAISSALSEVHHKIISPADDVTCEPTELPMLGEVTFQDAD